MISLCTFHYDCFFAKSNSNRNQIKLKLNFKHHVRLTLIKESFSKKKVFHNPTELIYRGSKTLDNIPFPPPSPSLIDGVTRYLSLKSRPPGPGVHYPLNGNQPSERQTVYVSVCVIVRVLPMKPIINMHAKTHTLERQSSKQLNRMMQNNRQQQHSCAVRPPLPPPRFGDNTDIMPFPFSYFTHFI